MKVGEVLSLTAEESMLPSWAPKIHIGRNEVRNQCNADPDLH
jgi:hypothetical protein